MAFHQLEKVLARAATNRSFRDELASGDADLDELGLSDEEQSVLSELVASSGAGLDAVLNVVTTVPTSAARMPRPPAAHDTPRPHHTIHGGPHQEAVHSGQGGVPAHPHPAGGLPGDPRPAPAFVPGMAAPGYLVAGPPDPYAAPGHYPGVPVVAGPAVHPSVMVPAVTHVPGAVTMLPGVLPTPPVPPATASPQHVAGYRPVPGEARPYVVATGFVPVDPSGQPAPAAHPNAPGSPDATIHAHRSVDASDVGRPVVARLPFGMDVVK